jgi:hypothetical protein
MSRMGTSASDRAAIYGFKSPRLIETYKDQHTVYFSPDIYEP